MWGLPFAVIAILAFSGGQISASLGFLGVMAAYAVAMPLAAFLAGFFPLVGWFVSRSQPRWGWSEALQQPIAGAVVLLIMGVQ